MSEDKKIELTQESVIKIWKLLENIRVSLDRIGAINSQGRDKMLQAMDEYFTSGIYREVADNSDVLTRLLTKELGEEAVIKLEREIAHLKFQLKKY